MEPQLIKCLLMKMKTLKLHRAGDTVDEVEVEVEVVETVEQLHRAGDTVEAAGDVVEVMEPQLIKCLLMKMKTLKLRLQNYCFILQVH
ncbi:unnamed protein product [Linum trigynum]|uniref:Uncharacterized protein n=1 Tax=Linum trigynum TaxID=586398 RepID=A0AAV2ELQ8_9ROSI